MSDPMTTEFTEPGGDPIRGTPGWTAKPMRKEEARSWRKLLKASRAVKAGWCAAYRPGANPDDYDLRFQLSVPPHAFYMFPAGNTDEDAGIGPYTVKQGLAFAKEGAVLLGAIGAVLGRNVSRRNLGVGGGW